MSKTCPKNMNANLVKSGRYKGVPWAIVAHMRHMCGYVRFIGLPHDVQFEKDISDDVCSAPLYQLRVNGGITYGPDSEGWIGFDTAHAFDWWPDEEIEPYLKDNRSNYRPTRYGEADVWTLDKMIKETKALAQQIVDYEIYTATQSWTSIRFPNIPQEHPNDK